MQCGPRSCRHCSSARAPFLVLQVPINIQLEGLGATSEQNFDFAQYPAMLRHRESISMDDLQVTCWNAPGKAPNLTAFMLDPAVIRIVSKTSGSVTSCRRRASAACLWSRQLAAG